MEPTDCAEELDERVWPEQPGRRQSHFLSAGSLGKVGCWETSGMNFGYVKFRKPSGHSIQILSSYLDMRLEFREVQAVGTNLGVIGI